MALQSSHPRFLTDDGTVRSRVCIIVEILSTSAATRLEKVVCIFSNTMASYAIDSRSKEWFLVDGGGFMAFGISSLHGLSERNAHRIR